MQNLCVIFKKNHRFPKCEKKRGPHPSASKYKAIPHISLLASIKDSKWNLLLIDATKQSLQHWILYMCGGIYVNNLQQAFTNFMIICVLFSTHIERNAPQRFFTKQFHAKYLVYLFFTDQSNELRYYRSIQNTSTCENVCHTDVRCFMCAYKLQQSAV